VEADEMSEDEVKYGQFCPVAKASEIITTRWTPLVLRELISGSSHFNEIHRGVPLMSRGLLSRRLKELEQWGVISKTTGADAQTTEYHLTEAGQQLTPIIVALGHWGKKWVESALESGDWDAGVLMWDMKKRIDTNALPTGRTVIHFDYEDASDEMRLWWLVADESGIDLCQQDPGFEVNLYVSTDVQTMAQVWIGKQALRSALDDDSIYVSGDKGLRDTIGSWLLLALVTEVRGQLTWTDT
jgi:DNA-binding HxlR family transcriptional regulator